MWSHNSSRLQERGFGKGKRICNRKEDLSTMFCYFAPVTRHSVQTMCTMLAREVWRSAQNFHQKNQRWTSLGGHDGAICAAKHLELVHAHHLTNPYTDLTNFLWGTKYYSNLYVLIKTDEGMHSYTWITIWAPQGSSAPGLSSPHLGSSAPHIREVKYRK